MRGNPKDLTQEEIKEISQRYLGGESARSISLDFPVKEDSILKVLRENGVEVRTKKPLSGDLLESIIEDYNKGLSLEKLSKKYNLGRRVVTNNLRKSGIIFKTGSDALLRTGVHKINKSCFDDITEENAAYFYGLLLSDGNLSSDLKYINIELKRDDEYILHKLREYVGSGNKILQTTHFDKRANKTYYASKFSFGDKDIVSRLVSLGFKPRKSLEEVCPDQLKDNRHFWRGFMDGDGSIYRGNTPRVEIHGGLSINESFKEYCNNLGVFAKIGYQDNKTSVVYTCRVNGFERSRIVADSLYKGAKVYLPRKYQTYLDRYVNELY